MGFWAPKPAAGHLLQKKTAQKVSRTAKMSVLKGIYHMNIQFLGFFPEKF